MIDCLLLLAFKFQNLALQLRMIALCGLLFLGDLSGQLLDVNGEKLSLQKSLDEFLSVLRNVVVDALPRTDVIEGGERIDVGRDELEDVAVINSKSNNNSLRNLELFSCILVRILKLY